MLTENIFLTEGHRKITDKLSRLSDAIDATNSRFSQGLITVGPQEQPPGDYAGGKIAFGRIPDAAACAKCVQARGERPYESQ